jgi:hypothetical protein
MGNRREYTTKWWAELKADPVKLEAHYEKQNQWRRQNPKAVKDSYKKAKLNRPELWLLKQAKKRAKDKGLEFSLVLEDIVIPTHCPIMGEPLQYIPDGYSDYSPSLDRVDSSKGYTKDNIQVISSIANRMKWNATREQLITFCKGVLAREEGSAAC